MCRPKMIPVIIGVGDVRNRSTKVEDAKEPAQLMLEAIEIALSDSQCPSATSHKLKTSIDSLSVVQTWTWPYADLPGLLAEKLGANPTYKHCSEHGGNQPAKLVDEAALRVASGDSRVAVVTGGETLASLASCVKAQKLPPPGWTKPAIPVEKVFALSADRFSKDGPDGIHAFGLPIHIYPLYENGFRAYRGQSPKDNHEESARLYEQFSQVAVQHPYAWNFGSQAETATSIGTVSPKNRMICSPYPLLMNAFNTVNLAAACVITTTEFATELGIPRDRWIYPLGGAGSTDAAEFWKRPNYYSSPAIAKCLDVCLASSGLTPENIDLFDFYSCFPIVPKLACHHLGLPLLNGPKPITLLGGLTSFGGAGNNYSMHAITEMVRQLRQGKGRHGLILANGGILTYQHALCLSTAPREDGLYPDNREDPWLVATERGPPVSAIADGEAAIEAYTVEFGRDGRPFRGCIIGQLVSNRHRFVANHGDSATLVALSSSTEEQIGKKGYVVSKDVGNGRRRNMFFFGPQPLL
ncbi:hypothetical protein CFD26_106230 [Aspergillus turcosus]|uniref:Thiolase-like protein type 1 additional C-terminal domain-containing protein n=1 Tax=Aspergillus turcosus TaxID=1245748 RepID=A0A3R7HVM0_9EURO|nr:hypothetical protein CFD26_106230 [Aspergillus turcosus]